MGACPKTPLVGTHAYTHFYHPATTMLPPLPPTQNPVWNPAMLNRSECLLAGDKDPKTRHINIIVSIMNHHNMREIRNRIMLWIWSIMSTSLWFGLQSYFFAPRRTAKVHTECWIIFHLWKALNHQLSIFMAKISIFMAQSLVFIDDIIKTHKC